MNVSEVIERLQELREQYGEDYEVYCLEPGGYPSGITWIGIDRNENNDNGLPGEFIEIEHW